MKCILFQISKHFGHESFALDIKFFIEKDLEEYWNKLRNDRHFTGIEKQTEEMVKPQSWDEFVINSFVTSLSHELVIPSSVAGKPPSVCIM